MASTNYPFVTRLSNDTFIAHSTTGARVGVTQNLRTAQLLIENAYASNTSIRWIRQVDAASVERWIAKTKEEETPPPSPMLMAAPAPSPSGGGKRKIESPLDMLKRMRSKSK